MATGGRHREINEEGNERERIVKHHPVQQAPLLHVTDITEVQGPKRNDRDERGDRQRNFVADHLGRFPHSAEQ